MPRVVRRKKSTAGQDRHCGKCGRKIEPGEEYLRWDFRYGGAHFRCTDHPPRQSDLTQSKMATVYSAVEAVEDQVDEVDTTTGFEELVESVADAAREIAQEYEDAAEPFGGQGENMERADELGAWADELEGFSSDYEEPDEDDEDEDEETREDLLEQVREQVRQAIGDCPL